MHIKTHLLAMTAGAASFAAAAAPPQITTPPSAQDLNKQLLARGIFQQPRQRVQIRPPNLYHMNSLESDCMYNTYQSITLNSIPPITDDDLNAWIVISAKEQIQTITDIAEVDEMCVTTDNLNLPASLTSAYDAWHGEFQSWKKEFRDEAYSLAEKCGTRYGPAFWMLVATDEGDCRTAVSAMFGVTATAVVATTSKGTEGSSAEPGSLSLSVPTSSSGSGTVEAATSTSTSTSSSAGADETNAVQTGGGNSGPQGSGAVSVLAQGGVAVMLAAAVGVARLL